VSFIRLLGHFYSANGSVSKPWDTVAALVHGALFAKFKPQALIGCSYDELAKLVDQHLWPVIAFRAAGWAYQETIAGRMDKLQRKLVALLIPIRFQFGDIPSEYFRRKSTLASGACDGVGRWSLRWASLVLGWDGHVVRNSSGIQWGAFLADLRSSQWLIERRSLFAPASSSNPRAWTALAGRTATRSAGGMVATRWRDGLESALEVESDNKYHKVIQRLKNRRERKSKVRPPEPSPLVSVERYV
jgi:hypothetical protein